jgi:hypothetical protein
MTNLVPRLFTRSASEIAVVWQDIFCKAVNHTLPMYMRMLLDGRRVLYGDHPFVVILQCSL